MSTNEQIISAPIADEVDNKEATPVMIKKMTTRKDSHTSQASAATESVEAEQPQTAQEPKAVTEADSEEFWKKPVEESIEEKKAEESLVEAQALKEEMADEAAEKAEVAEAVVPQEQTQVEPITTKPRQSQAWTIPAEITPEDEALLEEKKQDAAEEEKPQELEKAVIFFGPLQESISTDTKSKVALAESNLAELDKALIKASVAASEVSQVAQASVKSSKKRPMPKDDPEDEAPAVSVKSSKRRKITGEQAMSKSVGVVIPTEESKAVIADLDQLSLVEKKDAQMSDVEVSSKELSKHLE